MTEKGPAALKLPPKSKTTKTTATDQAKVKDPSQKTLQRKTLQSKILHQNHMWQQYLQTRHKTKLLPTHKTLLTQVLHCTYLTLHHYQIFQHIYQISPTKPSSTYIKSTTTTKPSSTYTKSPHHQTFQHTYQILQHMCWTLSNHRFLQHMCQT